MRVAFVKSGCPHCRKIIVPIDEINSKMNLKKRINTVDSYEFEHFKMMVHPIIDKLKFDAYPTLFIDSIKVSKILTKDQFRAFLDGFFDQDKIIPEETKWMREEEETKWMREE